VRFSTRMMLSSMNDTFGIRTKRETLSGFIRFFYLIPGLSLALQPWAGVSERLRRCAQMLVGLNP